jgi:hypothetical protein
VYLLSYTHRLLPRVPCRTGRDKALKQGRYNNETHQNIAPKVWHCRPGRFRAPCPPTPDARTDTGVRRYWGACTSGRRATTARGCGATAARGEGRLWLSASALAAETLALWVLAPGVLGTPSPSPLLAPLVMDQAWMLPFLGMLTRKGFLVPQLAALRSSQPLPFSIPHKPRPHRPHLPKARPRVYTGASRKAS